MSACEYHPPVVFREALHPAHSLILVTQIEPSRSCRGQMTCAYTVVILRYEINHEIAIRHSIDDDRRARLCSRAKSVKTVGYQAQAGRNRADPASGGGRGPGSG